MDKSKYTIIGMLIGLICMSALFGYLFFVPLSDNEEIIIEDIPMQIGQVKTVTSTNDDLEDLNNFKNLGYNNYINYWGERSGDILYIKKCIGLTGSTSTVASYDMPGDVAGVSLDTWNGLCCQVFYDSDNSNWWCIVAGGWVGDDGDGYLSILSYNITGDASYDDYTIGSHLASVVDSVYPRDIVYEDDHAEIIYDLHNGATHGATCVSVDLTGVNIGQYDTLLYSETYDDDTVWWGYHDGTYYWYVVAISGSYYIVRGDDGETYLQTGITPPDTDNQAVQIYMKQGSLEILMDADHLRYRIYDGTLTNTWRSMPDSDGTATNGIIWRYNDLNIREFAYIIWKDTIYEVLYNKISPIQTFTDNAYVGWTDWFSNGADSIYQMIPGITKDDETLYLTSLRYSMMSASFQELNAADVWKKDQLVSIYNDDDILQTKQLVLRTDKINRRIFLRSPLILDLNLPITLTEATNLDVVLENNLVYCTPSVTPTISIPACSEKKLSVILRESVTDGGYVWYLTPELVLTVDDGNTLQPIDYKVGVPGIVQVGTAANPSLGDVTENNSTTTVEAEIDKHKNVMKILATANGGFNDLRFPEITTSGFREGWVYIPSTITDHVYVRLRDGGADALYFAFLVSGDIYTLTDDDGSTDTGYNYVQDSWIHWHMAWTKSGAVNFYIDGINVEDSKTVGAKDVDRLIHSLDDSGNYFYGDGFGYGENGYTPRTLLWEDQAAGGTITRTDVGGRYRVLDHSVANTEIRHVPAGTTAGKVIIGVRGTDVTDSWIIYLGDSPSSGITFQFVSDIIRYYDTAFHTITTTINDKWYILIFTYDFATTWSVNINGTQYGPFAFRGTPANFDTFNILTSQGADHYYTDVIYMSWNPQHRGSNEMMGMIGEFSRNVKPDLLPQTAGAVKVIYQKNQSYIAEREDVGGAPLIYHFPSIPTLALATTKAEQILADLNKTIFQVIFRCTQKGAFQQGQSIYLNIIEEGDLEPKLLIYDKYNILFASFDEEEDSSLLTVRDSRLVSRPRPTANNLEGRLTHEVDRTIWRSRDIAEGTPDIDDTDMVTAGDDTSFHTFCLKNFITDFPDGIQLVWVHADATDNVSGSTVFIRQGGHSGEGGADIVTTVNANQHQHGVTLVETNEASCLEIKSDPKPSDFTIIEFYFTLIRKG